MNYLWASDLHLDHLGGRQYQDFIFKLKNLCKLEDKVLLCTGDTSVGPRVERDHAKIADACNGNLFLYVLGNHDRWNSSFKETNKNLSLLHNEISNARFLDIIDYVKLDDETFVVGDSGWYDGRNGNQQQIDILMNDWWVIKEFHGYEPRQLSAAIADACAKKLEAKLHNVIIAGAKQLIVLTHVPPYADAARYLGKPTDDSGLPWFSCKCIGEVIDKLSDNNPEVKFEVLCGHTHEAFVYKRKNNVNVQVAGAHYGNPKIVTWKPTLW
jgi:Icc protein